MTWEEVTHRDGQQLEQDTVWPPCKELRFHPINTVTQALVVPSPQEQRWLLGQTAFHWQPQNSDSVFQTMAGLCPCFWPHHTGHFNLCHAHSGGLSCRVFPILSQFPFPTSHQVSVTARGWWWVPLLSNHLHFQSQINQTQTKNLLKNKRLNSNLMCWMPMFLIAQSTTSNLPAFL